MTSSSQSRKDFYSSLPRKRSAVGVLIFHKEKLLCLEPTYKPNWVVPGGVVEKDESPLDAAIRECKEEIGLKVEITQFLCVDYKIGDSETGDAVHFLFKGILPSSASISLREAEIKSYHWLSLENAIEKFDHHLGPRIMCAMTAIKKSKPAYCHDGKIIL